MEACRTLFIEAGPQFNFLTNAKLENYPGDIEDQLKKSTASVAFGAGVNLPLGFIGGLRYVVGMTDLAEDSPSDSAIKERNFQIYVGWIIFGAK